jgi:hypothetical protein
MKSCEHKYISIGGYNATDKIEALCKEHGATVRCEKGTSERAKLYPFKPITNDYLIITHPEYKIYLNDFDHWATRFVCVGGCEECIDGWDEMKKRIEKEIEDYSGALLDLRKAEFIWTAKMGD